MLLRGRRCGFEIERRLEGALIRGWPVMACRLHPIRNPKRKV
jgi:hypothetical protein